MLENQTVQERHVSLGWNDMPFLFLWYISAMFRGGIILFLVCVSLLAARTAFATDQSSLNYQNIGPTFAPVVQDVSSTNYLMTASIDAIVGLSTSLSYSVRSGVQVKDTTTTVSVCGNGVVESGETCDSGSSNGACPQTCSSSCTTNSCPSGGGGVGSGGSISGPQQTGVMFIGRSSPSSRVIILKDGQIAATTIAGADGTFRASLSGLQAGEYAFGLYAEDAANVRSLIFAFPISIVGGTVATISGIFIAPTIAVDKPVVKRGDVLTLFGRTLPHADVSIQVDSDPAFLKTTAGADGAYSFLFDTGLVGNGRHVAKARATLGTIASGFGLAVGFDVNDTGEETRKPQCSRADLNCDGRVNLVDFSIAAYWIRRPLGAAFIPIEIERLNGDGKIDLVDFSIMAHYWTG